MRYIFGATLLLVLLVITFATTPALATTCSERRQVCLAYCEKNHHNVPKCVGVCDALLNTCISTGCWESKITAKRCGISRQ